MTDAPREPPRRGNGWTRRASHALLRLAGWRIEGSLPALPQFVVIMAPHTSNWDFPFCILTMFAVGLRITWYGKHTLFRFPVARLLRWFGGLPIDRSMPGGHIATAIAEFRARPQWVLGISPEGTRRRTDQWKLGFYHIAVGAGVPIVTLALDYRHRRLQIGDPFRPTGDLDADLAALAGHFQEEMARHPGRFARPALPVSRPDAGGQPHPAASSS